MELIQEPGIWHTVAILLQTLGVLALQVAELGFHWILWIVWVAWWLGAVNAKRARHVLATGGWAPAVLILIVAALVWSRIDPRSSTWLGILTIPNFWWQLEYVCLLGASALFCGWLQDVFHWTPPDVHFDPVDHGHDHASHAHH